MSTETIICAMCGTPMPATAEFCPLCNTPTSYSADDPSQADDFDFASLFAQADGDGSSAGASNADEDASLELDLMSLFAQGDESDSASPAVNTDVPTFASAQIEEPLPLVEPVPQETSAGLEDATHEEVAQAVEHTPSTESPDEAEEEDDLYDFSSLFAATDEAPPTIESASEDIVPVDHVSPLDEAAPLEAEFDEIDIPSLQAEADTVADDAPPVMLETTPSNANDLEVANIDVTAHADTTYADDIEPEAPEAQADISTLPAFDISESEMVPVESESSTQDQTEHPIVSDGEPELASIGHTPEPEPIETPVFAVQEEAPSAIPIEAQAESGPEMSAEAVDEAQDEATLEAEASPVAVTHEATPQLHEEEASPEPASETAPDLPAEDATPMQAAQPIEDVPPTSAQLEMESATVAEEVDTPESPQVLEAQSPVGQDAIEATSVSPLPDAVEDTAPPIAVQSAAEDTQAAQAPTDINAVTDSVPSQPVAVPIQADYVGPQDMPGAQQTDLPAFAHADADLSNDAVEAVQEPVEQEAVESAPVEPVAKQDEHQQADAMPAQAAVHVAESSTSTVEEPPVALTIEPQAEQLGEPVSAPSIQTELDNEQREVPYSAEPSDALPQTPDAEQAVSVALPAPEEPAVVALDEESPSAPAHVETPDDYHTAQAEEITESAQHTSTESAAEPQPGEPQAIEAPAIAAAAERLDDAAVEETPIPLPEIAAAPAILDASLDATTIDATMPIQAASEQPPLTAHQQADHIEDTEVVEVSGSTEQAPAIMAAPVVEANQEQDPAYEAPPTVNATVTLPPVLELLPEIVPEYEPIPTPFGRAGSTPSAAPMPDPTPFPPDIEVPAAIEAATETEPEAAYASRNDDLPYEQPTQMPSNSVSEADEYDLTSLFADIEEESQSAREEGRHTEPAPVEMPESEAVGEQPLTTDYDSHHEDLAALFAHTEVDDTPPAMAADPPPTSTPGAANAYIPPIPEAMPTAATPPATVEQPTPAPMPTASMQPPTAQQQASAPSSAPPTPLPGIPKPPGAGLPLDVLTAQFRPTRAIKLLPDDLVLADEPPALEPPATPVQPMASAPDPPSIAPAAPPTPNAAGPASVAPPTGSLSSAPAEATAPYAVPEPMESVQETAHTASKSQVPMEEPRFDVPAFAQPESPHDEPHLDSPFGMSAPPAQQAATDSASAAEHLPSFVLTPAPAVEAPPPPPAEDDLAALFASIEIEDDEEETDTAPVFAAEQEIDAPAEAALSTDAEDAVAAPSPQPTEADEHDLTALFADIEVEPEPAREEPLFEEPFKVAEPDGEDTLRGPIIETIPPAQASKAEPDFPPDPFKSPAPTPATAAPDPVAWPDPAFNKPSQSARSGPVYTTAYQGATPAPPVSWEQAAGLQPGAPRPKPGTPEYEAMVQAALAARSGATPTAPAPAQPTPAPQPYQTGPLPQQPPTPAPAPQPAAPAWDPNKPRPKPGTPEYEAMVQAALAARAGATPPAPAPAPAQAAPPAAPTFNDPYQAPTPPPVQPAAPAWDPSKPRPKPGTPEYEAMVQAILAQQRGASPASQPTASPHQTGPLPQQPPAPSTPPPAPAAPAWDPSKPRPKPGTPEYEEMVQAALRARLGQNPGASNT